MITKIRSGLMSISDGLRALTETCPWSLREAVQLMNPRYRFYRHNAELIRVLDRFINTAINVTHLVPTMPVALQEVLRAAIPLNLLSVEQLLAAGGAQWWEDFGNGETDPKADISEFIDDLPDGLREQVRARLPFEHIYLGVVYDLAGGREWWAKCGDGRLPLINPKTGKVAWRLIVAFPPRHGKSETVSCLLSAYYLARFPDRWVALFSYGAGLAYKLSKIARGYFQRLGGKRDPAMFQVRQWMTKQGGGFWAAGRGGEGTGKGFHLGICDDMLKDAREATSALIRERLRDWYQSVFSTRAEPPALEIQVSTRWHPEDLIGWQLEEEKIHLAEGEGEGWYVVHFSALGEPRADVEALYPENCYIHPDWRKFDEPLWPQKYPADKLKRILRRIGEFFFNALYRQRPTAREGDIFHVERIEIVGEIPKGLPHYCRAWDDAYALKAKKENAYSAGVKLAGPDKDGCFYVVDVFRKQLPPGDLDKARRQLAIMDGVSTIIRGPEDPAAGKRAAIQFVENLLGFIVFVRPVSGDKGLRCQPFANKVNIGKVKMLQAPWNRDFVEELRAAGPNAAYWDQIDAVSDAFDEIINHMGGQASISGGRRPDVTGIR